MLSKLLLLSVVFTTVVLPVWAAREPDGRRGLKKAILYVCLFNAFYLVALRVIYPRL